MITADDARKRLQAMKVVDIMNKICNTIESRCDMWNSCEVVFKIRDDNIKSKLIYIESRLITLGYSVFTKYPNHSDSNNMRIVKMRIEW